MHADSHPFFVYFPIIKTSRQMVAPHQRHEMATPSSQTTRGKSTTRSTEVSGVHLRTPGVAAADYVSNRQPFPGTHLCKTQPIKTLTRRMSASGHRGIMVDNFNHTLLRVTCNVWDVEANIQMHKPVQLLVRLGDGSLCWYSQNMFTRFPCKLTLANPLREVLVLAESN